MLTSKVLPSGNLCHVGTSSTMKSLTERSHSISLRHIARRSAANGSNLQSAPKTEAASTAINTLTREQRNNIFCTNRRRKVRRHTGTQMRKYMFLKQQWMCTREVSDRIWNGHCCADTLRTTWHIFSQQQLCKFLFHHLHLCTQM